MSREAADELQNQAVSARRRKHASLTTLCSVSYSDQEAKAGSGRCHTQRWRDCASVEPYWCFLKVQGHRPSCSGRGCRQDRQSHCAGTCGRLCTLTVQQLTVTNDSGEWLSRQWMTQTVQSVCRDSVVQSICAAEAHTGWRACAGACA